jgi:peptide/nickel transport system permease protein
MTNNGENKGITLTPEPTVPHSGEFRRVVRIFFGRKLAVVGLVLILLLIFTAIFAPWLAPYDPQKQYMREQLVQPSWQHPLGTDALGRDTLSRVIYGSRTSLIVGISAVALSAIFGQTMGLVAGYFGGITYTLIMRFTDALMSIPMLLIALIISALLGGGMKNVIFALAVGGISVNCRMMCSQALTIKQNDYIMAGHSIGLPSKSLILRHIFPNAFPPLLVVMSIGLGTAILTEAALSFLGIGIMPPICAWGSMINDGYKYLLTNPVLSFAPGLATMMVVFGFNMLGDGLRDSLDPRLRGTF